MLSKRLICLSLIVTTLFVSNRASGMATTVTVGTVTVVVTVHVPVAVAVVAVGTTVGAAGGICYGTYRGLKCLYNRFISPSQETIIAAQVAKASQEIATQAQHVAELQYGKQITDLEDKILVITKGSSEVATQLADANEKLNRKSVKFLLYIHDAMSKELRKKLMMLCGASWGAIKKGLKLTYKDHPYMTITVVVLGVGYGVHKKYGAQIRRAIKQRLPDSYREQEMKLIAATAENEN